MCKDTQRAHVHNCRVIAKHKFLLLARLVVPVDWREPPLPLPSFVLPTLTTSVTPVFGLNKSYDFITSILLLTSPSTTASSTRTPRPTTRTLTFHGAASYKTLRNDEKFRPTGSTSSATRTSCTPTRRRDAPPSTGRRVRSSTRIVNAPTTASGTNLQDSSLGSFFRIGSTSPTPCTTPRRFDIAKKPANRHHVEDTAAVNEHRLW